MAYVSLFVFCSYLQLDSDGTITIEEQIVLVLKAKVQCELNITAQLQEGGKDTEETVPPVCPTQILTKIVNLLLTEC